MTIDYDETSQNPDGARNRAPRRAHRDEHRRVLRATRAHPPHDHHLLPLALDKQDDVVVVFQAGGCVPDNKMWKHPPTVVPLYPDRRRGLTVTPSRPKFSSIPAPFRILEQLEF